MASTQCAGDYNLGAIKPVLKGMTWRRMYANHAMWEAGIRLANHSDGPAAPLWPWWGMEASITRGNPDRPDLGKMGGEHALTVAELVKAYTINAAWSLRVDDVTGTIEAGKQADMILLDRNLFEIPVTEISGVKVLKTLFGGEVVYRPD